LDANPVIIVNFKAYRETIGGKAIALALACDRVAVKTGADVRIAVSATDLAIVSRMVHLPVYAEHVDSYPTGKHTGMVLPEMIKSAGARGTILNHSEHKISLQMLEESILRCSSLGLSTVACAKDIVEARQVLLLKKTPEFLAIEPSELIGGQVSVSTARPQLVTEGVELAKELGKGAKLLVGAGIKTRLDYLAAVKLGADGVLLSSGITLAENPERALYEMLSSF
jgi:triosephosphate isomerase (TIM)